MIGCELSGGLGNQLFRYAFARALMEQRKGKRKNEQLLVNMRYADSHGFSGNIYDFQITSHQKSQVRRLELSYGTFYQRLLFLMDKGVRAIISLFTPPHTHFVDKYDCWSRKTLGKAGVVTSYSPDVETLSLPKDSVTRVFAYGSFEKYDYFKGIDGILKKEFTPIHPCLEDNKNLYDVIQHTNSVCLAVRRGDFMAEENKKTFYVCDLEYFLKAIDYMQQHVKNPVFIVFSNDIEWVKENLPINGDVYYESGKDPVWETFRLMYSCKHFIISNSTMHWWAQWRSESQDKIVVAPDRWYNTPCWENHLMLDSFIRIPTGVKNPYKL